MPGDSQKVRRWGMLVERHVCDRYGLRKANAGWHDARRGDGTPVEIKSTQRRIGAGRGRTKEGEFRIWEEHHNRLRRSGGYYAFAVYRPHGRGVKILDVKLIPAGSLPWFTWNKSGHELRGEQRQAKFRVSEIFG